MILLSEVHTHISIRLTSMQFIDTWCSALPRVQDVHCSMGTMKWLLLKPLFNHQLFADFTKCCILLIVIHLIVCAPWKTTWPCVWFILSREQLHSKYCVDVSCSPVLTVPWLTQKCRSTFGKSHLFPIIYTYFKQKWAIFKSWPAPERTLPKICCIL